MDARLRGKSVRSYNGFNWALSRRPVIFSRQQLARGIQFVEMEFVVTPRVACPRAGLTATSSSAALPARSPIPLIVAQVACGPPANSGQ